MYELTNKSQGMDEWADTVIDTQTDRQMERQNTAMSHHFQFYYGHVSLLCLLFTSYTGEVGGGCEDAGAGGEQAIPAYPAGQDQRNSTQRGLLVRGISGRDERGGKSSH